MCNDLHNLHLFILTGHVDFLDKTVQHNNWPDNVKWNKKTWPVLKKEQKTGLLFLGLKTEGHRLRTATDDLLPVLQKYYVQVFICRAESSHDTSPVLSYLS